MPIFRTVLAIAIILCALAKPALAQDAPALFYQPQETDRQITPAQWKNIWQQSRANGYGTLIVQWTSYGEIDFGGKQGWLAKSLQIAQDNHLSLIVGLHMDPAYYNRLTEIDIAGTGAYLENQLGLSLQQAEMVQQGWNLKISGWYVPLELDDWNFEQQARRDIMNERLRGLAARLTHPLHISSFSGGKLTPAAYARWLESLNAAGIHVWAQDGAGTGTLPPFARKIYLQALPCNIGIVLEAFRQTSKENEPFRAKPAPIETHQSKCHPMAVFGLRYMPWAETFFRP
ncbi:DUF4434 domain-containing protein [Thalassospira sp. TSL5-1]|uniref:DUF4434 domain-containing protein n=1 Tax=Thalassospira sp. TSL5-1 TaxID=1544451 RepID=UPI00093BCC48|nr:DUF4434 domain-containing protein [Thalassospira sp. TSL5-1]OKH86396.1 hypothetical protein LF95_22565 [Thalassospira sp. TSL5-1]